MPEAVADTVWHAITTDDPQLRYTVGPDAEKLVEAFAAMGSDEWLAHHNDPDDEAWARFFGDVSGVAM
jgi:hypothetical protein